MIEIAHAEASAAILAHVEAGTLVQNKWHGRGDDGREIACLLGAIHPSVTSPAECNGALMPMWLAELTPVLFDGISQAEIYPAARRFGELVGRWHALSPGQWDAILNRVLIRCIDDAMAAARPVSQGKNYWLAVESACAQCRAAIESSAAARAAASAAARAAASAAWSAAERAESAASAAARAAASVAWSVAWSAAESAASAASAAWSVAWSAAESAASAAASAAERAAESAACAASAASAAYLSLFRFLLGQIEAECGA
jgi:hypothetical protein